jgi:hypothetical protein
MCPLVKLKLIMWTDFLICLIYHSVAPVCAQTQPKKDDAPETTSAAGVP